MPHVGVLEVYTTTTKKVGEFQNIFDGKKVPKGVEWRFRKPGDMIEKFGGGRKSLNEYLIDKKVPARLRDNIPVLALDNEVYVIAGVEISDLVKLDKSSKSVYGVNFIRF